MGTKPDDADDAHFTPDKQKLYEEWLRTGMLGGVKITNHMAMARAIGTSLGRINRWQYEKNLQAEAKAEGAMQELEILHKKKQHELIGKIVKVALGIIIGVGAITTGMYIFALAMGYDTKIIESNWSNMFGILLTNSFSIIGTIMGVKYATEK